MSWQSKLLGALIFAAIAYFAVEQLWGTAIVMPSIGEALSACSAPTPVKATLPDTGFVGQKSPAHLPYTRGLWPWADRTLCVLVSFFTEAMRSPAGYDLTLSMLTSFTPVIAFTFFEGQRTNRSLSVAFPVLLGVVYQQFGAGITFPAFYIFFLLSDSHKMRSARNFIVDHTRAISVLCALVLGYLIPLYAMMSPSTRNEYTIAIWQPFPVIMAVVQAIVLHILPIADIPESGTSIVRLTYFISFLVSAVPHLYILRENWGKIDHFQDMFVPFLNPPKSLDAPGAAKLFLQWDLIFTLGSTGLVSLWFAKTPQQVVILFLGFAIIAPILSPGAAFSILMYWREGVLERTSISMP